MDWNESWTPGHDAMTENFPSEGFRAMAGISFAVKQSGRARLAPGVAEADAPTDAAPLSIAPLANTFEVGRGRIKHKALFVPESETKLESGDKFEAAEHDKVDTSLTYGLNKRGRPGAAPADAGAESFLARALDETQQFREDVAELPEMADLEAYDAMPVEAFGEAMLRGMGWERGKGIGRHAADVEAIEYVKRDHRLGLGAQPAPKAAKEKKFIKPGESRAPAPALVLSADPGGAPRNVRRGHEALVPRAREGPAPGKRMVIVGGPHRGLAAVVLTLDLGDAPGTATARVRLETSGECVTVRPQDLGEMHLLAGASAKRPRDDGRDGGERDGGGGRGDGGGNGAGDGGGRDAGGEPPDGSCPWLRAGIRVRVVSKSLEGGRFYLRKATVADVPRPGHASLVVDAPDGARVILHAAERHLETVVGQPGSRVMLLAGSARGATARLLAKGASGAAAVQLESTFEFLTVPLDDLADYTGQEEAD